MALKKAHIKVNCELLHYNGLRHINGKFFFGDDEVTNIKSFLINWNMSNYICEDANDVNKILDTFLLMYPSTDEWYDLPLIKRIKETCTPDIIGLDDFIDFEIKTTLGSYFLTHKQLVLLKLLLFTNEPILPILSGTGGSGKSTFLNLVKQLFGNDYASATLDQLSNNFTLHECIRHRLVCADEVNSDRLDYGKLKTLVSQEEVMCSAKYQDDKTYKTQSRFIFCCNKAPRIDITDEGMGRRIIYVKMNTVVAEPIKGLDTYIYSESELLSTLKFIYALDIKDWKLLFRRDTREILVERNSVYTWYKYAMDKVNEYGNGVSNPTMYPPKRPSKDYDGYLRYRETIKTNCYNYENFLDVYEKLEEWGFIKDDDIGLF